MITGFAIENFKGVGERLEIELRPLTLLFGANSAGKSTILHALHYAREVFERRNLDADRTVGGGEYIDLGGFRNFVHNRERDRPVQLSFKVGFPKRGDEFLDNFDTFEPIREFLSFDQWTSGWLDCFGSFTDAEVAVSVNWSEQHHRAFASELTVSGDGARFATIKSDPDGRRITLRLESAHSSLSTLAEWKPGTEEADDFDTTVDERFEDPSRTCLSECLPTFLQFCQTNDAGELFLEGLTDALPNAANPLPIAFRDEDAFPSMLDFATHLDARRFAASIAEGIGDLILLPLREVIDFVTQLRYLGPLRETPPRHYAPPRFPDPSRWASGLGAWDTLHAATSEAVEEVSHWLGDEDRLNSGYHLQLKQYKELDLSDPLYVKLLSGQAFDDVTPGTQLELNAIPTKSRLVIVPKDTEVELSPHDVGIGISQVVPVIVTALNAEQRVLCIEQPELHLHPRLQAELGDLFIHASLGERRHVVLLETHSEHLILRLLRRVRETAEGELPVGRTPLRPNDLIVYYIEGTAGGAKETSLEVDESGDFIDRWPHGFFDERAKELF